LHSLPVFHVDIHPTAVVDKSATIGTGARIGAGSYVEGQKIGENAILYPNVTILDECTIGKNTVLWSGTVVRERCHIGTDCIIHPNAVMEQMDLDFAPALKEVWSKYLR
jgi:UDP-3-O-[3-hydroxymyristoyl] glucosamine N-acyltransferase